MNETGLTDAVLIEHGYAMAMPLAVEREVPAVALPAHVEDVAPDSGTGMGTREHERRKTP